MFPVHLLRCMARSWFFVFLIVSLCLVPIGNVFGDDGPFIILNKSIPENSLTNAEIGNIFLGKKTTWSNNNKITFVILADGDTHKQFVRTYLNKSQSQFRNYWKQMLFTGKGIIPQTFTNEEKLIEYVSQNENTIGYISKKITAPGVKLISAAN